MFITQGNELRQYKAAHFSPNPNKQPATIAVTRMLFARARNKAGDADMISRKCLLVDLDSPCPD